MKKSLSGILTLLLALVVQISFAQEQQTVSGTVTDDTGIPLPGVNVLVQGTTRGVQTDFDGNYAIDAATGEVLVFSYLGMKTVEYPVEDTSIINVELSPDAAQLDEVVVTTLGIKREEKSIGYARQSVGSEELTTVRDANVVNSLSGKIAGVNVTGSSGAVGASSRIVLRGSSTIYGNDQPLMVVDGVVIDNTNYGSSSSTGGEDAPNGLADINQNDIASIEVLKGGPATALYGMRGANGVLLITTKSGSSGKNVLGITVSNSTTFEEAFILPDYQNSYGQGSDPNYFEYIDGYSGDGGVDESWGPALDSGLEFIQWNSFDGEARPWVSHPDNVRDFFETGITTNNNVAFDKAGEGYSFRTSMGLTDQKGIIYNTDFRKYNFSGNADFDLSDNWSAGFSANYIKSESDNLPTVGYGDPNNQIGQLVWSARQVDIAALRDYKSLPTNVGGPTPGTPRNWNQAFNNNPYWALDNNTNTFDRNRLLGNVHIDYTLGEHFSVNLQTGIDYFSSLNTSRRAFGTYTANFGSYEEVQRTRYEINSQALINYNNDINEDFSFSLSVGGNSLVNNYHRMSMEAPQLQLPDVYNIANTRDGVNPVLEQFTQNYKINSLFGFGQLSFRNYAFLDFSGRNDWASVLPLDNNNFFYPSITASVVLSDMLDLNRDTFSFLKLRGGWAQVGSAGPLNPYSIYPSYQFSADPWGTTPVALLPGTLWNSQIKNELSSEYEIGLDARLFQNRLRFDITYYDKVTEDVIMPVQVSAASGYTSAWQNAATVTNKGIEVQLGADIIRTEDFNFGFDVNFGKNENLVTDIDDDPTTDEASVNLGGLWNVTTQAREGHPIGVLYGPAFERDPGSGEIIFENGLPLIDEEYQVLGNATPDWTGGLNLNLSYKNFSLTTLFDVKMGGDIYSQTNSWGKYAGILEETTNGRETGLIGAGVMQVGDTYVPNNVVTTAYDYFHHAYSQAIAESSVYDASFVKWRQLALTYSLPSHLLDTSVLQSLSFGVTVRNLAILYKEVPHIDPESAFSNSTAVQGLEYAQIPSTRSIGFNVNVKF